MKITNLKYTNLNLANTDDRGENFYIDFIISSFLGLLMGCLAFENWIFIMLIYFLVRFVYYFGFEYFLGRTPGKFQTQSKVVSNDGGKPKIHQLIFRNISRFVSIFSGISDDERAIHDIASNTFVIKNEKLRKVKVKRPLFIFLLVLMIVYDFNLMLNSDQKPIYILKLFVIILIGAVIPSIIRIIKRKTTGNTGYK